MTKFDLCVPLKLTDVHLTKRIGICYLLIKGNESDTIFKLFVIENEKLVIITMSLEKALKASKVNQHKATSKADIYQEKLIL